MKKNIQIYLTLFLVLGILVFPSILLAEDNGTYQPLATIEGLPTDSQGKVNISDYIPNVIKIIIQIAGGLAVIMIVIGGIQYLSTDAIQGKEEGKERIKNAIYGLLLALGAFIILNTINERTLSFDLSLQPVCQGDNCPTAPPPVVGHAPVGGETLCKAIVGGSSAMTACSCNDCVDITTGAYSSVPKKSGIGNQLSRSTANKLKVMSDILRSQNVSWYVTEAWKPTWPHQSTCHITGTCFDANLTPAINPDNPTPTQISLLNTFFLAAKQAGFSTIQFEVRTSEQVNTLYSAGVTRSLKIYANSNASGTHFHIGAF